MDCYYLRSLSFPSKSHPVVEQFDEQLCRLRSSLAASSSSSLNQTLANLKDLYRSVDELLQLPLNQQAVSQRSKWTEEVLDGSLRLLNICGASRDVLVESREHLQDIQSVLRRRYNGELYISNEVVQYLNTRKTAKKLIKKCLKNIEVEQTYVDVNAIGSMFKDVEAITVDICKTMMSYIGGTKVELPKSKWSIVSKLMRKGGAKDNIASTTNSEFDVVDATLESIVSLKNTNGLENMRSQMMKLDSEIQVLDEALESLFRHLVKTRSTFLNILSN